MLPSNGNVLGTERNGKGMPDCRGISNSLSKIPVAFCFPSMLLLLYTTTAAAAAAQSMGPCFWDTMGQGNGVQK